MKRVKKKATIISTKIHMKKNSVKAIKSDKKLITLTAIFAFGLLLGALFIRSGASDSVSALQLNIIKSLEKIRNQGFLENGLFMLKFQSVCMFVLYFLGVSTLGEGFLWFFPAVQGFLLGTASSFLYSRGSVTGMSYFGTVLLLPAVFAISSFLLSCKESILTERDLNRAIFLKEQEKDGKTMLKLYSIRYVFFYLGNIFSSFLFALLCLLFGNKFNLSFLA